MLLTKGKKAYFKRIKKDYKKVKKKIATKAGIVHNFKNSQLALIPQLQKLAFLSYLKDLLNTEIYSSYKLPSDRELKESNVGDPVLAYIISATKSLL